MYKTVLFKGQWQKNTIRHCFWVWGFSLFPLFLLYFRFSSVRLCYLTQFPITFIKYTFTCHFCHLRIAKVKKKCHTNQYQRKVKIHWSFCNKVQERLHIAHYLYSHWSWRPWSHGIINLDQRDRQRKLAVGVTFYLISQ